MATDTGTREAEGGGGGGEKKKKKKKKNVLAGGALGGIHEGVLDDLTALGPFFAVGSHPPGRGRPAMAAASELADRRAAPATASRRSGQRWPPGAGGAVAEIEPRVAASAAHLGLVARLVSPALGAAVLRPPRRHAPRRALVAGHARRPGAALGPPAGGTGTRGMGRVASRQGGRPGHRGDRAAGPRVRPRAVGKRGLGVNGAAAQVARQRPTSPATRGGRPVACSASPWLRDERHPPGPAFRRSSCCLFYRLAPGDPSAVCGDCVLAARPGETQIRSFRTTSALGPAAGPRAASTGNSSDRLTRPPTGRLPGCPREDSQQGARGVSRLRSGYRGFHPAPGRPPRTRPPPRR